MNHLRQLIDTPPTHLQFAELMGAQHGWDSYADIQKFAPRAQCFWLGEDGESVAGMKIIPDLCRLPFDVCWFESTFHYEERAFILGVLIVVTASVTRIFGFRKLQGTWMLRYTADCDSFAAGVLRVRPNLKVAAEEAMEVWRFVASFLSALHCTNVRRKEHKPDPKILKARARRGKAPLFSYWTLQLDGKSERGDDQGGTHRSPRVHLRRGHPRQGAPGMWTWVQAHAVGDRASGMVHKDYCAGPKLRDSGSSGK